MIFLNEKENRVILSARKCGLMSLSNLFNNYDDWKNYSSSTIHQHGNPDPLSPKVPPRGNSNYLVDRTVYPNELSIQQNIPFDNAFWKDTNVVLIIRDPWQRYVSGFCQLTRTVHDIDMENLSHNDGHTANWLYITEHMMYKSLTVVKTDNLTEWFKAQDMNVLKINQTEDEHRQEVEQELQANKENIMKYLELEYKIYNNLLDNNQGMQYN
tara:strand:- start:217 stop:852 length:636 start_codon:yes stop_codon:yes gene_type:complete